MPAFRYPLSKQKPKRIIGLMSGTSLDGLDVALCHFRGSGLNTRCTLEAFRTERYGAGLKQKIIEVFAKPHVDMHQLVLLHALLGDWHGRLVLKCLRRWNVKPEDIAAIASHGQTVFHAPRSAFPEANRNATLQVGDGDHLAVATGIPVVSDFRQKHVAAGGEGAPLAVYGDYLLFSKPGEDRLLLNIGGIANFTWLPASGKAGDVLVTDTGPGNTLPDQFMRKHFQRDFDRGAGLARRGAIHNKLLEELLRDRFFKASLPKTTGPEWFNLRWVEEAKIKAGISHIKPEDELATLTRLTAESVTMAMKKAVGKKKPAVFVSGGGAHNPLLMRWLKDLWPEPAWRPVADLGIPGDAKEAVLFAVLANETLSGSRVRFEGKSKIPSVLMGKISLPG
jgi:anhydro-N-acetylmuramic acid kinase